MSRSSYSDDYGENFPNELELFRANVERSIKGAKGQARIRELRDALLAMPDKALEAEIFVEATPQGPQMCALGAWALARCGGDTEKARRLGGYDDYETSGNLKEFGWPKYVVREIIYMNDDGSWRNETPAERYTRMLRWCERHIVEPSPATR